MESWNISWTTHKDVLTSLPKHWQLEQYWNQVGNRFIDLITGEIIDLDKTPDFIESHLLPIHWERRKLPNSSKSDTKSTACFINLLDQTVSKENPYSYGRRSPSYQKLVAYLDMLKFETIISIQREILEDLNVLGDFDTKFTKEMGKAALKLCQGNVYVAAMDLLNNSNKNLDSQEIANVKKYKKIQHFVEPESNELELIGEGKIVFKLEYSSKPAVAKLVETSDPDFDFLKKIEGLKHNNIVKMLDTIFLGNRYYLVMELCEISLYDYYMNKSNLLDADKVVSWCIQMISALWYLHDQAEMAHGNLKPSNVLLVNGFRSCKLSDMKVDRMKIGHGTGLKNCLENCQESGPEAGFGNSDDTPEVKETSENSESSVEMFLSNFGFEISDTFNFGTILFSILTRGPINQTSKYLQTPTKQTPILSNRLPKIVHLLITFCWQVNEHNRPSDRRLSEIFMLMQNNGEVLQEIDNWFTKGLDLKLVSYKTNETPGLTDIFSDISEIISGEENYIGMEVINEIANCLIQDHKIEEVAGGV